MNIRTRCGCSGSPCIHDMPHRRDARLPISDGFDALVRHRRRDCERCRHAWVQNRSIQSYCPDYQEAYGEWLEGIRASETVSRRKP